MDNRSKKRVIQKGTRRKGDGRKVTGETKMTVQRMADLERRVQALEERTRRPIWCDGDHPLTKTEALVYEHGEYVDKTLAAKILGVTRATVYAMLADGRIAPACEGRRVDVRSIGRYMTSARSSNAPAS